jgi:hypothetical protein
MRKRGETSGLAAPAFHTAATNAVRRGTPYSESGRGHCPRPGRITRRHPQRHQPIAVVVLQPADHRGHAAQGGLRAGAAGFAQGNELARDFDEQDVGRLKLRFRLGHDGTPFRPTPDVAAVGDSEQHRG